MILVSLTIFVYTQLNGQTVVFLSIQFNVSHLFAQFKYRTFLFDPHLGHYLVLPLRVRVDLGVLSMKGYSTFLIALGLEPHLQIVLCIISRILIEEKGLTPLKRFYSPSQLL